MKKRLLLASALGFIMSFSLVSEANAFSFSSLFGGSSDKEPGSLMIKRTKFKKIKGWENDRQDRALNAFVRSCDAYAKLPSDEVVGGAIKDLRVRDFRNACELAGTVKGMGKDAAKTFFETWFVPYSVSDTNRGRKGLFTGYYEIELQGSLDKGRGYDYPVYARPDDLTEEPYYTRRDIMEDKVLEGQDLELYYVDDKVGLFFLEIQGSGRIVTENGVTHRVAFDGKNNQPYKSIGKILKEEGKLNGTVSAFAVQDWLRRNPSEASEIMNRNESFVFFREMSDEHVVGSQGVPLTPERSLAVDRANLGLGIPVWLDTKLVTPSDERVKFRKLMVAQDTGGAIKGAVRGDIFFGHGERAEELASFMQEVGSYVILVPKSAANRIGKKYIAN